jgi:6-phosphogluconolactonase
MSTHRHVYADPAGAAAACARQIASLLEPALHSNGQATLVISGGDTPGLMLDQLARVSLEWKRIHLFWVDERAVPPGHPDSNFSLADRHLITPLRLSKYNVHRIRAELGPHEAVRAYEEEIRDFFGLDRDELPHFDVLQCGAGAGGHTASLFPGEPLIDDRSGLCAAVFVESLNQWRITLLPGVLLAANNLLVLATGAAKAAALRDVLNGPYDPKACPAQLLSHHGRRSSWFLDAASAALLD